MGKFFAVSWHEDGRWRLARDLAGLSAAIRLSLVGIALVGLGACGALRRSNLSVEAGSRRVVRMTRHVALEEMATVIEIREESSNQVSGRAWLASGNLNRETLPRYHSCHVVRGARGIADLPWSCELPFPRGAPDWRAVLGRLDALGIMAPPKEPPRSSSEGQVICMDGAPWSITVRHAAGRVLVQERELCGARSVARRAFEAGVDSVLREVGAAAAVGQ